MIAGLRGALRWGRWVLSVWVASGGAGSPGLGERAALAQPDREQKGSGSEMVSPPPEPEGGPELDASCPEAELFGGTRVEQAAWCHAREGAWVSVRTLARRALDADASSVRAHYLMGLALHLGEANLPKARYHLTRAERLLEASSGGFAHPVPELAVLEQRVLLELVYVYGEMDDHETKIAYVEALERRSDLDYSVLSAWPLLKLGRFEEARRVAEQGLDSEHDFIRSIARTALCAVESEQRNRFAAYEACRAAADAHGSNRRDGAVELTNAGASAEELLRLDEAEELYLAATLREPEGTVNPWGRLVQLYMREGRLGEALTSWRRLVEYRERRPNAHLRQQDAADAASTGAALLLLAGRTDRAAKVTARLVDRPDRKGTSSAAAEQAEAGLALMAHVAHRTWSRRLEEKARYAGWAESFRLRADAVAARYRSWVAGRRVLKILSDPERLATTLRPEAPGSIEGPAWLDPDVVGLVGAGVALAAIERSKSEETLPPELAGPVFALLEAEAHAVAGRWDRVEARSSAAISGLPQADALLRARAHLRAGQAAWRAGRPDGALEHYRFVLRHDPGLFRRLGEPLPVRVAVLGSDPMVVAMAERVGRSSRFDVGPTGFELRLDGRGATLSDVVGGELTSTTWPPAEPKETPDAHEQRCFDALHEGLFAPSVDLTQADVRSLDGTIGGGLNADEILDGILREGD